MAIKEEFKEYLPDIVDLDLESDNIKDLFLEISGKLSSSGKVCNSQAARREFALLSKQWGKMKESLLRDASDFLKNGVFPFTINYCPFLYISNSLLFIGRLKKKIDLGIEGSAGIKVICVMLFHSVEAFQKDGKNDVEKEKLNLYWNNLLKNSAFIDGFLSINSPDRFMELISMSHSYLEKRRYPRYSVNTFAYCNSLNKENMEENKEKAEVKDISLSGLLLRHIYPLKPNDHVGVNLMINDKVIYIDGKVCRCREVPEGDIIKYSTGINISRISPENRSLIEDYINQIH